MGNRDSDCYIPADDDGDDDVYYILENDNLDRVDGID